jgi:hypothetical protein
MDGAMSAQSSAIPERHAATRDGRQPADPIASLWDAHFREPAAAVQRARAALDDPRTDERTRAWADLTLGWHQLYFTADPATAADTMPLARERFERLGERRGELLARIGSARLALIRQNPAEARRTGSGRSTRSARPTTTRTGSTRRSATCTSRWRRCVRSTCRRTSPPRCRTSPRRS